MAASPFINDVAPARDAFTVTPSDTVNFTTVARSLYFGGAGTATIVTGNGVTVLFSGIVAGTVLQVNAIRINATGTTATLIVGLV